MIVQCNDDVMDSYIDAKQDLIVLPNKESSLFSEIIFGFSEKPGFVSWVSFKSDGNLDTSSKEYIKKERKNEKILLHLTNLGADCPVNCMWCALRKWSPILGRSPHLIRVD